MQHHIHHGVRISGVVGELDITLLRVAGGRLELAISGEDDGNLHRLRVLQNGVVFIERVVRSVPALVSFLQPPPGDYELVVEPLPRRARRTLKSLTWSDWDELASGSSTSRSQHVACSSCRGTLAVAMPRLAEVG